MRIMRSRSWNRFPDTLLVLLPSGALVAACNDYNCHDLAACPLPIPAEAGVPTTDLGPSSGSTMAESSNTEAFNSGVSQPGAHTSASEATEGDWETSTGKTSQVASTSERMSTDEQSATGGREDSTTANPNQTEGEAGVDTTSSPVSSSGSPECEKATDCDDGLQCNGLERCLEGECAPSTEPFCASSAHCDTFCSEGENAPRCFVEPQDEDGDGEGSPLCEAAPGDDCNDDDEFVFSTATEVCNGVDNNCNNQDDVTELGLANEYKSLQTGAGAVIGAWSEELEGFAILEWFSSKLRYYWANTTGTITSPKELTGSGFTYDIAAGHDGFAYTGASFQIVDKDGNMKLPSPPTLATGVRGSAVVSVPEGWVALYVTDAADTPFGKRFDTTGAELGSGPVTVGITSDTPSRIQASTLGSQLGIVWDAADGVYLSRYTDQLGKLESRQLNDAGRFASIASGADRYGVAWVEDETSIRYTEISPDGETLCGPNFVGVTVYTGGSYNRLSLARYREGFAVLFTDQRNNRLYLLRISDGCQVHLPALDFEDGHISYKNDVRLNGNANGLIATWRDGSSDPRYRLLGGHLCDAPSEN